MCLYDNEENEMKNCHSDGWCSSVTRIIHFKLLNYSRVFLWNRKKCKIAYINLIQDIAARGIKLVNILSRVRTTHLTWIKAFWYDQHSLACAILKEVLHFDDTRTLLLSKLSKLIDYGLVSKLDQIFKAWAKYLQMKMKLKNTCCGTIILLQLRKKVSTWLNADMYWICEWLDAWHSAQVLVTYWAFSKIRYTVLFSLGVANKAVSPIRLEKEADKSSPTTLLIPSLP